MNRRTIVKNLGLIAASAVLACGAVLAGGPLALYDPATKTPYAWPGAQAPVFTDLGNLGTISGEDANAMVLFAVDQWNAVPTSSFTGTIAGDFASIGLPDIDASNIGLVLGAWNGGGVHVVYDEDGLLTDYLFGPWSGVLGFTVLEFVSDSGPGLLEATTVLNGTAVPESPEEDPTFGASSYTGVITHEFGHAINLAHSQSNGQIVNWYEPWTGPAGCGTPYMDYPSSDDMETMYPFINLYSTAGIAVSTVDVVDDMSALSNVYPGAGWPGSYPSIRGTIYVQARANTPQRAPLAGSNVIARNVANPYRDAVSAISGDFTQGMAGPDGSYAFHGLTPGASYVVYVDGILAGAFATPNPTVLPGPEEYWNGASESGNGVTDDRCAWQSIQPVPGGAVADVVFNKVKGAPEFVPIELPNSSIAELSGDGQAAIGYSDFGLIRWTPAAIDVIGGDYRSPSMAISHDGGTLVASTTDADGNVVAGIWMGGQDWMALGGLPDAESCDNSLSSGWGVSNDQTVVGLAWLDCSKTNGFQWTSGTGMTNLGDLGSGELGSSRANHISADASTIVGWDTDNFGSWRGAIWRGGQESLVYQEPAICCDWEGCLVDTVGEAWAVNPDGSIVIGDYYQIPRVYEDPWSGDVIRYCESTPWRLDSGAGLAQPLGGYQPEAGLVTHAFDLTDNGNVIVGRADPFGWGTFVPLLWTEPTGWVDFQAFLAAQGTYAQDWLIATPGTISGNGTVIGGWAYSPFSRQGWIVNMPKVVICHAPKGNPGNKRTIDVVWPDGLAEHLAHGDTIGQCGNGQ